MFLRCRSTLFGIDCDLHSLPTAAFAATSIQSEQPIDRRLDSGCLRADHLGTADYPGLSRLRLRTYPHGWILSLLDLVQFLSSIVEPSSHELDINRTAHSHIPFRAGANIDGAR